MLKTFEDLVNACLGTGKRYHLLYVYMKMVEAPPREDLERLFPGEDVSGLDTITSFVFDAHEPVKPGLTFEQMRKNADSYHADWDVVFIMTLRNADDSPVTDEEAKRYLTDMKEKIATGNFPPGAPIFDKKGHLKGMDRAAPIRLDGGKKRMN